MSEYLSISHACFIAMDLQKNPDNLEMHLEKLAGLNVKAEALRQSNLEGVIGKFVHDEDLGELVTQLLMEYREVSSEAEQKHDAQMERLRKIRDSLYPERPPRDTDLVFKRQKWSPLPYDRSEFQIQRLFNDLPLAVVAPIPPKVSKGRKRKTIQDENKHSEQIEKEVPKAPKISKGKKRKAIEDANKKPAKFGKVEIQELPIEGEPVNKRIILKIRFDK